MEIEYINKDLQHLFEDNIIQMQHSVPYTPQQNGVAERKSRALKEMARCMFESNYLSPNIWYKAINCAAYAKNSFP